MLNMIRFSTLFLGWRARRAGMLDGRALIPPCDADSPPPYLDYLRGLGHWWATRLEWRWHQQNETLFTAYAAAVRTCQQAQQALDEAEREYRNAEERRMARGTDSNIKALRRWTKARERGRRDVRRAELAVAETRARRQIRWEAHGARYRTLAAETEHYMQVYSDANVKARDDNDCPPGLLEANRPRLAIPEGFRELNWDLPGQPSLSQESGYVVDAVRGG